MLFTTLSYFLNDKDAPIGSCKICEEDLIKWIHLICMKVLGNKIQLFNKYWARIGFYNV